jgi:two-component system nitrate/nitrite sensor histidine kinase NarX
MQEPVPSTITEALSRVIERFRQETGMSIAFVCDDAEVPLRRAARHEIERIVQEALTNIRKHSGARCVTVSAGLRRGRWMVSIEDDGRGFPFAGHWTHWQLDQAQQGPFVIKQRARAMGATVSLSSTPGRGARLELEVPLLP